MIHNKRKIGEIIKQGIAILLVICSLPIMDCAEVFGAVLSSDRVNAGGVSDNAPNSMYEDVTITEDLTLEADKEIGNLTFFNGTLDLNGHTLQIHGDFIQANGNVVINGGKLIVDGDYRIQSRMQNPEAVEGTGEEYLYSLSGGTLKMTNPSDYVLVKGDFVTDSNQQHTDLLTNGVLEVQGDFTQLSSSCEYNFVSTGSHKLYLTGGYGKTVSFASSSSSKSRLANLEIAMEKQSVSANGTGDEATVNQNDLQEESGLTIEGAPYISGYIIDEESEEHPVISGEIAIGASTSFIKGYYGGDVRLGASKTIYYNQQVKIGGNFNCNGYKLTVGGELQIGGDLYSNYWLNMSGGKLTVGKDLTIDYDNSRYGLTMNSDNDYITVYGDFLYRPKSNNTGVFAGTLEVKGDFVLEESLYMQGTHKVILSGEHLQTIKTPEYYKFHILELQNYSQEGVYADNLLKKDELIRNGCKLTYGNAEGEFGEVLTQDREIEGDYILLDDTLDLNGHNLTIKGDFIHQSGTVYIHGGCLTVEGDYRMQKLSMEEGAENYQESTGILRMTDDEDLLTVKGDMYILTSQSMEDKLTAGVIDLKGNFYQDQISGGKNYAPGGNHTLRLSGDGMQTVQFQSSNAGSNSIRDLEVVNSGGVLWKGDVYVKGNIRIPQDTVLQGAITITEETTFENPYIKCDISVNGGKEFTSDFCIDGNLTYTQGYSDPLKITSGTLNVTGNLTAKGNICIEHGHLITGGNLNIDSSQSNGGLQMSHEDDFVTVEGDFEYNASNKYFSGSGYLTAGTLQVKGDFTAKDKFVPTDDFRVLLSGDRKQTIQLSGNSGFAVLELNNHSDDGVYTDKTFYRKKLIKNGCRLVVGDIEGEFGWKLTEDTVVEGDLVIIDGTMDLNGYNLTVTGDLVLCGGELWIHQGSLTAEQDFRIQTRKGTQGNYSYELSTGSLKMQDSADKISVKGSFIYATTAVSNQNLTAGTLEIEGDFIQSGEEGAVAFNPTWDHTVVLCGRETQHVINQGRKRYGMIFRNLQLGKDEPVHVVFEGIPYVEYQISCTDNTLAEGFIIIGSNTRFVEHEYSGSIELWAEYRLKEPLHIGGDVVCNSHKLYLWDDLSVDGSVTTSGEIILHQNTLHVGKDLTVSYSNSASKGLSMTGEQGCIKVEGDFSYEAADTGELTAGTLEIEGDFTALKGFCPAGSHRVVLSGGKKQTIRTENGNYFHILEFQNDSEQGIYADPVLDYDILISGGCKLNYGGLQGNSGFTLSRDTVIADDYILTDGVLDLNGYQLIIEGNFLHAGGTVLINGGTLEVKGDYRIQWREGEEGAYSYSKGYGRLLMNSEKDRLIIGKSLIVQPGKYAGRGNSMPDNAMDGWITAGEIVVEGNLEQKGTEAFITSGSSILYLAGNKRQNVTGESEIRLQNLYVHNNSSAGVCLQHDIEVESLVSDLKACTYGQGTVTVKNADCVEGTVFGGNLRISGDCSLSQNLQVGGSLELCGVCDLNGNSISVNDNLTVGEGGALIMRNPADYICIMGDMDYLASGEESVLTAGTLEIRGNFTKQEDALFAASEEHVTVLSGKQGPKGELIVQNIKFQQDGRSGFHKLVLKQPFAEGYLFSASLEQIADEVVYWGDTMQKPTSVTRLGIVEKTVNSITIEYEGAIDENGIAGYRIYRDGEQIAYTESCTYTDGKLMPDTTYAYRVFAVDVDGNVAADSPECQGTTLADVTPPAIVSGLTVTGRTGSSIRLSWNPSTDDTAVAGYILYRNGEVIADHITENTYKDTGLKENTLYTYMVVAFDGSGNQSNPCEETEGAVSMPRILAVSPKDYDAVGGESAVLRVTFKDSGSSVGNKVDIAYYDSDADIWKPITMASLGQSRLNDMMLYAETDWDISRLTKDGDVDVRFTVTDEDGNSTSQIVTYYLDRKAPRQVDGIRVENEEGNLRLKWNRCLSADTAGYLIYRMEESSGQYTLAADIEDGDITTWLDSDVETGKTYTYHIRAYDGYGQKSVLSERISATADQDTAAPQIISVTPYGGKISGSTLIEIEASDNRGLQEINIYIRKEGDSDWILLGTSDVSGEGREAKRLFTWNTKEYEEGGYELKAEAVDEEGNGTEKEVIRYYRIDNTGIAKVVLGECSSTSTAIQLTWEDVTEEDFGYFAVEQQVDGQFVRVATVTDKLGVNIGGLLPKTAYTFRVVGYDISGNRGEESDVVTIQTKEDQTAPSIKAIEPAPGSYSDKLPLKMTVADNAAVGEAIFSVSGNGVEETVLSSQSGTGKTEETFTYEWDISSMPEGEVYVKFQAADAAGNWNVLPEGKPIICTYRVDHTAPGKITGATAEGGEGYIHISWNEPEEKDVVGFVIYRAGTDGIYHPIQTDCRTKDYYDVNVEAGDGFSYKVAAVDEAGNEGEKSEAVYAMALRDEEAPVVTGISPEKGSRQGSMVTLKTFAKDNAALSAVVVEYREKESEDLWREVGQSEGTDRYIYGETDWNTAGLKEEAVYEVRAKAIDRAGNVSDYIYSEYSFDLTAPAAPDLTAKSGSFRVELSWSDNTEEDFDYYKIYRAEVGTNRYVCIQTGKDNVFEDVTVEPDTMYSYKIQAYDIYGNYSESKRVSCYGNSIDTIAPEANIPQNIMGVTGLEVGFDATASTDNVRIVSYEWDFGDGNTKKGTRPTHIYEEAGAYTVTLTVTDASGNRDVTTGNVIIRDGENNGMVTLTVTDTSGNILPFAYVYVKTGNHAEDILNLRTDGKGRVQIVTKAGIYQYAAYAEGYLPKESTLRIDNGNKSEVVLGLEKGEVITGELNVHRMELEELVEAGVDMSVPENFHTFTFTTTLVFAETPIPIIASYTGDPVMGIKEYKLYGAFDDKNGDKSISVHLIPPPKEEIANEEGYNPTLAILQVTQSVSWLKEMYGVELTITNHANEGFDIEHAMATLTLPEGVSLAATTSGQSLCQPMNDITGGSAQTAKWVVKGDKPGEYKLNAAFHGVLMPFEADLDAEFETESEFEVAAGNGLHIYVMPEAAAYIGETYYIQYKIVNESDRTFYNLTTTLGEYIEPQSVQDILIKDSETGEIIERSRNTYGVTYSSSSPARCRTVPVLYEGDEIEIGVFEPGDVLYGTYSTACPGTGDPDEVYYRLVDSFTKVLEGKNLGVEVSVVPINSHVYKYVLNVDTDPLTQQQYYGDPVDTSTGAFTQELTLLAVGGTDTISMDLTYRSMLADTKGECGYGFSHSYEQRIEDRGNCLVLHMDPFSRATFLNEDAANNKTTGKVDGNRIILDDTASYEGIFLPVTTDMAGYTIEKNENGYILNKENGGPVFFDTAGRLCAMEDTNGRRVSVTYSENAMTVTEETSGESLHMTYNGEGMIASVSDDHGRTATLSYDGTGNLVSFTDVAGNQNRFVYDEAHYMTEGIDAAGAVYVKNTYDSEGRVLTQWEAGKGQPAQFAYENVGEYVKITITDHNGNTTTVTNDSSGRKIEEVNGVGSRNTYLYNRQGELLDVWDHAGNNTAYEYDDENRTTAVYDTAGNITRYHYDAAGNMKTLSAADGSRADYEYDSVGNITRITDPSGAITSYTYDACGRVVSQSKTDCGTMYYEYDEKGRLAAQTDYNGNRITLAYDAYGNLVRSTDPCGGVKTYVYNANGWLMQETDEIGCITEYTYDNTGKPLTKTLRDAEGMSVRTTSYSYYDSGLLKSETDPEGNIKTYEYDNEGNILSVTYPTGIKDTYTYDAAYRQTSQIDPDGTVHSYTYDMMDNNTSVSQGDRIISYEYYPNGKVQKQINADGTWLLYTYDNRWNCIQIVDQDGVGILYSYDEMNRLVSETDALGNTTRYTYDLAGRVTSVTDPNGNTTSYEYDGNGNCIRQINALSQVTEMEYDKANRLVCVTGKYKSGDISIRFAYDAAGNVTSVTDEEGAVTYFTYDIFGNVLTMTDAMGNVVASNTYDKNDNLLSTTDGMGNSTGYTYDKAGNLLSTIECLNGQEETVYTYEYDSCLRPVKVTDPLKGVTSQSYDQYGNVVSVTDACGGTTTYSYDEMDRLISTVSAVGSRETYTYNAQGLLAGAENARGQKTEYRYDLAGRITEQIDEEGTVTYTYDNNGNVLTVTECDAKGNTESISRTYDALNRVTSVTDCRGKTIAYAYDELGNRISLTYPGGEIVRYTYYRNGNLKTVTDWDGNKTSYEYDKNGRLIKTLRADGSTESRSYNKAGYLTDTLDVTAAGEEINHYTYAYDGKGNITSVTGQKNGSAGAIANAVMSYDADNRLISFNGKSVTYDADGNMLHGPLSGQWADFTYDCRNRLVCVETEDGQITRYEYDAEDIRTAMETDTFREEYVTDRETVYSQILSAEKTYQQEESGVLILCKETTLYAYGQGLISETGKNGRLTYHFDHLGSTTAITGEDGRILLRFSYSAYGELTGITDGSGNSLARAEENETAASTMIACAASESGLRFLYNGQLGVTTDSNGLYHMRARYYNTNIRRFINRDILSGSIAESGSLNRYAYAQGNPVNHTDPFGLCPQNTDTSGWSARVHMFLDVAGVFCDPADIINAVLYLAEGDKFMAALSLLSAVPVIGSIAGFGIKAAVKGTKYLAQAEKIIKYLKVGSRLVSHTSQATVSGIDTYYAAVDAYHAYQNGELGADELISLGLSAMGTVLSTKAAAGSGGDLYRLMGSDGVGCRVVTGITGAAHCFAAGTPVSTEEGKRPIEEISAGDRVWAYDEETGREALKEVEETFVSETDRLIHIQTDGEEIITTELHPFYVEGLGFVQAGCLKEGYELRSLGGGSQTVRSIQTEWLEEPIEVYNIRVSDYHTYYVGQGDILVHNTKCEPKTGGNEGGKEAQGVGNPVAVEGRGNTGRTVPNTLNEQMAMNQVQSNPLEGATKVPLEMTDPRWPASEGWVKMQSVVQNADGTKTTIHYVYNEITGAFDDFKFK